MNTVVWFDLPVLDLDRAVTFYRQVMNCDINIEEFDGQRIGVFAHGESDVAGCLYQSSDNKPSKQGVLVYFNVEGRLEDAVDSVISNNGDVIQDKQAIGPHGFRAIVLDSEGNRIALHSNS